MSEPGMYWYALYGFVVGRTEGDGPFGRYESFSSYIVLPHPAPRSGLRGGEGK